MPVELPKDLVEDPFWVRVPPPVRSMIVFTLLFAFAWLLGIAGSKGGAESDAFVQSVPWTIWRFIAGAALAVFVVLTVQAVRILQRPKEWGMFPTAGRRNRYLLLATVGAVSGAMLGLLHPAGSPDLPVQGLKWRTGCVLVAGMLASIPWLTIVWLAHAECHDLEKEIPRGTTGHVENDYIAAMQDKPGESEHLRSAIERLEQLWQLLLFCVGAFAFGVVAAVASAGALRGAFVAAYPQRDHEFPPANVLMYGLLFALGLSIIAVPMAVAWRNRAHQLVKHACPLPPDGKPTAEWVEERHRIERLLHLDSSIVRNPLTVISVLAPLLISALAAFLPQVAG
ncbi:MULTISPECIES: hypothetical protein [unclassified Kribbella]|uniref:hypothetical protein n=1 Tax=unclassified Kribbella TaxID=2644121 RepID=UPI0030166C67